MVDRARERAQVPAGKQIMWTRGLNKSNAASLPLRAETSYLEPNVAQIEPFQHNYVREQ